MIDLSQSNNSAVTEAARQQEVPRTKADPKKWLGKVEKRYKDLKKAWLDDARKIVQIYECKDRVKVPFNILYSNTETILPSLYNSTPRPEVARRYTTLDQQGKALDSAVAQTGERVLEYFADTNHAEYETFSDTVKEAVKGFLVPGLGQARVKYHEEGGYQTICFEPVPYDRFVWAYARRWKSVPWVAFGHDFGKDEFEAQFPEFVKSKKYKDFDWEALDGEPEEAGDTEERPAAKKGVLVWEVWNYSTKQVLFLCDRWEDELLDEDSYPQHLTGRFPCPKPLMFLKKFGDVAPVPSYHVYEQQAEELNVLTRRIIRIGRALRVRGLYSGAFGNDLEALLNTDDDNVLVGTQDVTVQDGLDKYIWMMPIDMLVQTLQNLYVARDQCKQVIYELIGISDILRGASNPNETARAQEIKNNWGSMRVKRAQKDVQEFCLDLFRISFEYAASYFAPATYAAITKLPFMFQAQVAQIQQGMAQFQTQQAMAQQQPQQTGQQPPQAQPPFPPEVLYRAQLPTWEQIVQVLQDSFERSYRIDIETNSTVDLEATEDKQDIAEFMNAFGQMSSGLGPMIESGSMPFDAARMIMGETFRRFRFGRRVQEAIEMMQAPKPPADPKQIEKQVTQQLDGQHKLEMQQKELEQQGKELAWAKEKLQLQGQIVQLQVGREQDKVTRIAEKTSMQTDYQGKMRMQQQQAQQALASVQDEKGQLEQKARMQELNSLSERIQSTIQAFEQKVAQGQAQQSAEQGQQQQETLVRALEEMKEALASVAQLAGAERESVLTVGPDGQKRAISRPVVKE